MQPLIIFEQGASRLYFISGPANYGAREDGSEGGASWRVSSLEKLAHTPYTRTHACAHTLTTHSHRFHCPFSAAPHGGATGGPGSHRALSRQEAPTESGSLLGLETPLGTAPVHRACWPGHPNSHPLTVLSARLHPTPRLKCETTAGHQPRGLGFHHTRLPTPRPEARV